MSTTLRRHEMFIDGKWTPGEGAEQEIINPATGKVIAHVPKGTGARCRPRGRRGAQGV